VGTPSVAAAGVLNQLTLFAELPLLLLLLRLLCCVLLTLQITHTNLCKDGDLICPGCGQAGCLTGGGMRAGHVTVVELPRQFWVFSFNLEHKGCSQRLLITPNECSARVPNKMKVSQNMPCTTRHPMAGKKSNGGMMPVSQASSVPFSANCTVTCTHPTFVCCPPLTCRQCCYIQVWHDEHGVPEGQLCTCHLLCSAIHME
jgi:hypothetical protein